MQKPLIKKKSKILYPKNGVGADNHAAAFVNADKFCEEF